MKFKSLIAVALLSSFSSVAAENIKEKNSLAPEATAAEAELSFRDIPYLENAFIDTAPADRKDGISVGELGVDGGRQGPASFYPKKFKRYWLASIALR